MGPTVSKLGELEEEAKQAVAALDSTLEGFHFKAFDELVAGLALGLGRIRGLGRARSRG